MFARKKAVEISQSKRAPQNLDTSNETVKKYTSLANENQKILKGWERNRDKIESQVKRKLAKIPEADHFTKEYHVRKIVRRWGGDIKEFMKYIEG